MTGARKGAEFGGLSVLGPLAEAAALSDVVFINGIASERTCMVGSLGSSPALALIASRFVTLIHPLAAVSRRAAIGHGSCIGPGCAVSAQVEIGAHAWLGSHAVIGHECVLGAGVTVAPSATLAGGVTLGAQAYVGSGALLRPRHHSWRGRPDRHGRGGAERCAGWCGRRRQSGPAARAISRSEHAPGQMRHGQVARCRAGALPQE